MSSTLASLSQPLPTSQTLGVFSGAGTTETVLSLSGSGPAVLSVPAYPNVDGRFFRFQTAGIFSSPSMTPSFTLNVYLGNSATIASDTQLISLTPFTVGASGFGIAGIDAVFFWSSTTGKLVGLYDFVIGSSSWTTGQTFGNISVASQSNLQFVLSGTFGTSNASNSYTPTQFEISLL